MKISIWQRRAWYIIGAAIFAANIGSEHLVGLAGTGAKSGVGMAHWEMQGWMILLLGCFLFHSTKSLKVSVGIGLFVFELEIESPCSFRAL